MSAHTETATADHLRNAKSQAHHHVHSGAPVRLGRILFVVLILLGIGVVAGMWPRLQKRAAVAEDTKELAVPTVVVVQPAPAALAEPLRLSAELRPYAEASIYARANGYVRRWLVDLGAHVEEGQLLAELDTPELDRELVEARADVRQAEAARTLSQSTAQRWERLLAQRTISPQEADERKGDLSLKVAAVESALARVTRLEELLRFAKITAPFSGTVTRRGLDVGQLISAGGGQELYRITQTEKLRAFVRVPQNLARSAEVGKSAELTLPEMAGKKFEAKIVRSAGAVEAASRTLLVELEVENTKGELLAGSYAQMRLVESRGSAPITVPANCLLFRAEGPQLGLVDANQKVELRSVELGRDLGTRVEVLQGVSANDRVILNPPDALVNGVEVRLQETPESPPVAAVKH